MKPVFIFAFASLFLFPPVFSSGQFRTFADLDGNGTLDTITAIQAGQSYGYVLTINNAKITGHFNDGQLDKMETVDINQWDKYTEVLLHTPGPSNDDEYIIYWYDGKNILFIDHLSKWPEFIGNGIVYVNKWEGFWSSRDKYVLDNQTRKLNPVKQYAYYVGRELTITKGFEIFREKEFENKVALLKDSSTIELLLCDKENRDFFDYRFLVKTESGLLGWTDFKTLDDNCVLPLAD